MRSRSLALMLLAAMACDPSVPSWGGTSKGDGDDDFEPGDGWMALGQGELAFDEIDEGDTLLMVLGGQGSLMFPVSLRGGGFTIASNPNDFSDPDMPLLDIDLDVEGFNIGFGGHFSRVANYPIPFEPNGEGQNEFLYVAMFVPDELTNPCDVDGLPGELHAELRTADGQLLVVDRSVILEVPESLGSGCS